MGGNPIVVMTVGTLEDRDVSVQEFNLPDLLRDLRSATKSCGEKPPR